MNLRQIDLNLLLVFDTVYRTRSNTKAAEELGVTQSAVSNAMKRLRQHLDDQLFRREGSDFLPTPEADRIAPSIRAALRSFEDGLSLSEEFDPKQSDRVFSILMPDPMEPVVLNGLVNLIQQEGLGIKVRTQPFFGVDIRTAILEKQFDLGLVPNLIPEAEINSTYLLEDEACIIARADHPVYGDRETFSLEDMQEAGLAGVSEEIRRHTHIDHELRAQGIERNHVAYVTRLWSVPYLVSSTDLVGACSQILAKSVAKQLNLKLFKLPLGRPTHHWHMIWSQELNQNAGHRWLRIQIEQIVRDWHISNGK